jgi:phage terminase small subunit
MPEEPKKKGKRESNSTPSQKRAMREEIFAREYVADSRLNGQEAAIRAGYSPKTARAAASRLLTKSNVQAMIAELTKAKADALDLKAEQVLRELKLMGFSNMLDYIRVQDGDAYIDLSKLTREQAAAIQEITVEEYTEGKGKDKRDIRKTRFKLTDKRGSLELLGRHLKLFSEKVQMDVKHTFGGVDDMSEEEADAILQAGARIRSVASSRRQNQEI